MQLSNVSKRIGSAVLCCFVASFVVLGATSPATAATEAEIEQAIVDGLAYLAAQQNPDGSWGSACETVGFTGLVCLKFEDRARELGFMDPTDPGYQYGAVVDDCLNYILGKAYDEGPGRAFNACPGGHDTYNTSIAVMALSASNQANPAVIGPEVAGGLAWLLWAQNDPGCGVDTGGWAYGANVCTSSDNSNGGYATLGLDYASAPPPRGWGLTIPAANLADLSTWITALQDPTGFSWYWPGVDPWPSIYRTGNLLQQMAMVGDTPATPRVQLAVGYIEANWNAPGGDILAVGWLDHRQAMFGMMKGFESLGIESIDAKDDGSADDWFDMVSTHLVATQNPDGSWPVDPWSGQILSTAWALLTLEKTVAQSGAIPVVSEWGVVIMTLMLLIGAKVYFSRRRAMRA